MNILVACEESQAVTIEMRKHGHNAYSCDIEPCSGGHPEWHYQQDVVPLLEKGWDMIIGFPPCTHLSVSGAALWEQKRKDGRQQQGIDLFMRIINAECPRIAVENPVGLMNTIYRKPDQIIQPWMFGHPETKKTCLWLKGLPLLIAEEIVYDFMKSRSPYYAERIWRMPKNADRAKMRSKTYPGVAAAMGNQWGRE
jgi:hypothetical protein